MNMLILKKQKHNEPEFDELNKMLCDLKDFLNEDANPKDKQWNENFNIILDFQDSDGSFKLFDSYEIPMDARVDFCYVPTYLCTAILMKAYLSYPSSFTSKEKDELLNGLKMSCTRNLIGHGYEGLKGQIDALNIFMKAGLNEFIDLHSDFCPEFSEMVEKIISTYQDMESEGKFFGLWGESYEDEIKAINKYFHQRKVFVYGTLMSGETNHHYLKNSIFLSKATIKGYNMYDVGWYPAIVTGNNLIVGELYQVPLKDMSAIDMLEGEGSLYIKKCEKVTDEEGKTTFAFVYVYIDDVGGLEKIPAWNREYLWYVSYGSNMDEESFMRYIKGGTYDGLRNYTPCEDTSLPLAVKTVEIPYDMYFGKESITWGGSGVSFLDTTKNGITFGVAYLITKEQFKHVSCEENGGRCPGGGEWYEDIIDLEEMDGFKVKTITNKNLRDYNPPSQAYRDTLIKGIKDHWSDMSDNEIKDYLDGCIR